MKFNQFKCIKSKFSFFYHGLVSLLALSTSITSPSLMAFDNSDVLSSVKWEEKFFNPATTEGDVIFPLPCDGAIVFRKVFIPLSQPLEDYSITLGRDNDEWGFVEYSRPEHIAGSFTDQDEKNNIQGRYYLIAKYELTQLQYESITQGNCPKPSKKLLLPQTKVSWVEAMTAADKLNVWLREYHSEALPSEDGQLGFIRLPTETEWEFAARGGLSVTASEFREALPPMQGSANEYIWYAGAQSANGNLQLIGLLKPNPLGIHDMLGNAQEMMFEPFRMNKLDRQHGQAGGYVVRGGSYLTQLSEIRSSLRNESPYYDEKGAYRDKTHGIRFVMVVPALTSSDKVKVLEQAWLNLGNQQVSDEGKENTSEPTPLDTLANITDQLEDEKAKKELEALRTELRANAQARDEQRDEAIRSSLELGAFLCTKLKDDGEFYARLEGIYAKSCEKDTADETCMKRKAQLDDHKKVLDFMVGYYADTLVSNALNYRFSEIEPQTQILKQQMQARAKSNLNNYLETYWDHLQHYWKDGKISKDAWLAACKATD
ncbi:SUMF1/EgtB/PvdO family nonheme iron enzyme [Thorsellia anophelis]|uniref:Formylglycine-generating enzyme, required for sulfatase activity, contains SUMF1/FGE domain n=1 Tax=Thorsellia anophelis DSM 18579 TaxID=1123402 RepID=A0A1H9ZSP6_9GAMM|nr:SUMF1/EgtB/PvdO family nonheme iron enzyme [Thorsellia anophelis]SES84244.1 Formylglycine-generating enzyme, required for sulfatase activity, contains SUMF1/FGE domain [Thorsellia anophelis DSM 18579]